MNKILRILPVVLIVCMIITDIFAADINKINDILNTKGDDSIDRVDNVAKNIWATVVPVVQILSVGAVVFAGLRYMFASADSKANIKKSMTILITGAILVFCSTTLISFIANVANNVLK